MRPQGSSLIGGDPRSGSPSCPHYPSGSADEVQLEGSFEGRHLAVAIHRSGIGDGDDDDGAVEVDVSGGGGDESGLVSAAALRTAQMAVTADEVLGLGRLIESRFRPGGALSRQQVRPPLLLPPLPLSLVPAP